ncbi:MAG: glycosyltransferase family 4 protein [Nitrososphaeria archaeon]
MPQIKNVCLLTLQRIGETYGGIESFVLSLSSWLSKKGINAIILARRISFFKPVVVFIGNNGVKEKKMSRALTIKLPLFLYAIGMLFSSFFAILMMYRLLRHKNFDLIHAQDPSFSGFAGVIFSKITGIPLLIHSHGPPNYILEKSFGDSLIWRVIESTLIRISVNNALLTFVTDRKTESVIASIVRKPAKIASCPTAINFQEYQNISPKTSSSYRNKNKNEIILGFIGRLTLQKNPEIILKALAELNDVPVKMYVVGDGPLLNQLKDKVCKLGIQNKVHFFGSIPERRKLELLQEIDIFLMPSLEEGCPIALLEAMAAGKAIIASNIYSIRNIVNHLKEAVLVNPYNIEELKQAILTLYNNLDLRIKLSKEARRKAKQYDVNKVYDQILKVYESVMQR